MEYLKSIYHVYSAALSGAAVALIAVAVAYVPGAIWAAAPTAAEFIQQLGSMTPAFAN